MQTDMAESELSSYLPTLNKSMTQSAASSGVMVLVSWR